MRACLDSGRRVYSASCWPPGWLAPPLGSTQNVLIVRDPRDVAVSAFYYGQHPGVQLDEYVHDVFETMTAWVSFRFRWYTRVALPTLVVFYEDMLASPDVQLRRLLRFLALDAPMAVLERVANATSADAMRRMEAQGTLPGPNRAGSRFAKVRAAQAGRFAHELSPATVEYCNRVMLAVLPPVLQKRYTPG